MHESTLPFAVQLSADRKYVSVTIPVASLPAELRRSPAAINVRLAPETQRSANPYRWVAPFLLALLPRRTS